MGTVNRYHRSRRIPKSFYDNAKSFVTKCQGTGEENANGKKSHQVECDGNGFT